MLPGTQAGIAGYTNGIYLSTVCVFHSLHVSRIMDRYNDSGDRLCELQMKDPKVLSSW